jgi:hypothetical protein
MIRWWVLSVAYIVALGLATRSSDAAVTIQSAHRSVTGDSGLFRTETQQTSAIGAWTGQRTFSDSWDIYMPGGPWDPGSLIFWDSVYSTVDVRHQSTISPHGFSWSERRDVFGGSAVGLFGAPPASARSTLNVDFSTDGNLDVSFAANVGWSTPEGWQNTRFRLTNANGSIFDFEDSSTEAADFAFSTVLDPGTYTFTATASIQLVGQLYVSSFNVCDSSFTLTLQPQGGAVPEPASLAIWSAIGGLGILVYRRTRRFALGS